MSSTMAATTWKGWIRRPRERWQAVVTGATEDEAWRLLRLHVETLGVRLLDSLVAAANVDPNVRTATRRRF